MFADTPYPLDVLNLVNWTHDLNQGLLAWWLVLPHSMGGTRWVNLAGPEHGTLVSMATTRSATSGWATTRRPGGFGQLSFDGTDDRVRVADAAKFSFTNGSNDLPFSLSAWVYLTTTAGNRDIVNKWNNSGGGNEWRWYFTTNSYYLFLTIPAVSSRIARFVNLTGYANTWFFGTATYDGSESVTGLCLYRNGVRVDTTDDTTGGAYNGMGASASEVQIGASGQTTGYANGALDSVRIYNRELSPDMVAQLYQEECRGYPRTLNRVAIPLLRTTAGASLLPKMMQYHAA